MKLVNVTSERSTMTYKLSLFAFCAIFSLAISTLTCSGFADGTYKYTDSDNNWQKISSSVGGSPEGVERTLNVPEVRSRGLGNR